MKVQIVHSKSSKVLGIFEVSPNDTVGDLKKRYQEQALKYYVDRQGLKVDPKQKMLKNEEKLADVGITDGGKLYFKDLGPQIGWTTVFLTEYTGPLVAYLLIYLSPTILYGAAANKPRHYVVDVAAACWIGHFAKRLLETLFVHRFSNGTMPILNIFKNSGYYWGFAAFVAYFVNHPLYTAPCDTQIKLGLALFVFSEVGNLSIHVALRNLRPAGSKVRRIPVATSNPFTWIFSLVSCPNYTYETLAWIGFSIMTQCLPAVLFTLAGFYQMAVWAAGKHRNYRREFKDYPRIRKPIVPFLL